MEQMSLTAALNKHFGKKVGQTMSEFSAEIKTLTPEDREYFKKEFAKIGVEIVEAAK